MLRPSTAPRWNRHTKTGRERAAMGGNGRYEAKAALARNSGSRPKLNNASPPDFTNTRLEIDIDLCPPPLPPVTAATARSRLIASETPARPAPAPPPARAQRPDLPRPPPARGARAPRSRTLS